MSYPCTQLPCQICGTLECNIDEPGHDFPVMISIARAGKNPTGCGIFCHEGSEWNKAYLLHDIDGDRLSRREKTLHTAAVAVRQIATFLADNPHESATGRNAIRRIFIRMDVAEFIEWYHGERRTATSRCADLVRDLDDAAALVGELGEYRPDVEFIKHRPLNGRQGAPKLALHAREHHSNSKLNSRPLLRLIHLLIHYRRVLTADSLSVSFGVWWS